MAENVIQIIRDQDAKRSAIRRYAQAFDHFASEEQTAAIEGRVPESVGAHEYALLALRAYRAEVDNPEPREPH